MNIDYDDELNKKSPANCRAFLIYMKKLLTFSASSILCKTPYQELSL